MNEDINKIFEEYLTKHSDSPEIDFAPLLQEHPDLEKPLQKKIKAYQKILGIMKEGTVDQPEPQMINKVIAGCKILKIIGQGGMGVVYLAHQEKLNRDVVIKVLRPFAAENESLMRRFQRESQIIAKLDHENIVPVYDVGQEEGSFYIIMKYIEGVALNQIIEKLSNLDRSKIQLKDLASMLARESQETDSILQAIQAKNPTEFFCNLISKVADAIQYAHDKGVVHRDIKPSNIIVRPDGTPVLLDFGLGRAETEQSLTISGEFLGTPVYSAPESFQKIDPESYHLLDVYSLGVTLYELLTGGLPYEGDSIYEIYSNIKNKEPLRPKSRWKEIPRDLDTIILKAIYKEPQLRYQSVSAFSNDLQNFLNYLPITAKAPSTIKRAFYLAKRKRKALLVSTILLSFLAIATVGIWRTYRKSVGELDILQTQELAKEAINALIYKKYDKAYREIEQLHLKHPDNTSIHVWFLGMKAREADDPSDIIDELKKLELKAPNNFYVKLAKMVVLHKANRINEANAIKKEIITIASDNPILQKLPLYLFSFGVEDSLVIEFLELALEKYPENAKLHFLMNVYCQQFLKNEACAQQHIEEAAKLNPNRYLDTLAEYYAEKETRISEIGGWIRNLKELNQRSFSQQKADFWYALARLYSRINECDEAQLNIKKALNLEPLNTKYKEFEDNVNAQCSTTGKSKL